MLRFYARWTSSSAFRSHAQIVGRVLRTQLTVFLSAVADPHRSDYRKSLQGEFIRIRLKTEQNCRLFWDIFNSAIVNDLFMTFTSRLKVDAKCVYQQWNWITVENYFGTSPADWVHWYLYFEPSAWIWTKGFRRYSHIVKNWSGYFPLNSIRIRALGWPLLGIFFGILLGFFVLFLFF